MATAQKLFELGAHFGHKSARTNPKARDYIYKYQNGVSIIDLFKTVPQIEVAQKALEEAGKSGKQVLLVATKNIVQGFARELGKQHSVHYMTEKWIGGFFTNRDEVAKNIKRINTWITERDTGVWDSMIKHERSRLEKELTKYLRVYGGVLSLENIPDIIVIVDLKKEKNALVESKKIRLKQLMAGKEQLTIVGIADTNVDPTEATIPVVVNDDTASVVEYVLTELFTSYELGKKKGKEAAEKAAKKEEKAKKVEKEKDGKK